MSKHQRQEDVITDPDQVARIAFAHEDGVIVGDKVTFQSYVEDGDGHLYADVYISDVRGEGGGAFRYRIEYVGPAPEPGSVGAEGTP